jgi:hypothetical protein
MTKQIVNITTIPRTAVDFVGRAMAVKPVDELSSVANYLTVLRAVNPAARITLERGVRDLALAVKGRFSATNQTSKSLPDDQQDALKEDLVEGKWVLEQTAATKIATSQYAVFMKHAVALTAKNTGDLLLQTLQAEEEVLLRLIRSWDLASSDTTKGGTAGLPLASQSFYKSGSDAMTWTRFFRYSHMVYDVQIGPLLDSLFKGKYYELHRLTSGKASMKTTSTINTNVPALAVRALESSNSRESDSIWSANDVLHALFTFVGEGDKGTDGANVDEIVHYFRAIQLVDFLACLPKIEALLAGPRAETVDPDPKKRYDAVVMTARLMRVLSLEPVFLAAAQVLAFLEDPVVKAGITNAYREFYDSETYRQFATRASGVCGGPLAAHVMQECASSDVITRFGTHPLVRVPRLVRSLVGSDVSRLLTGLSAIGLTSGIAGEGTSYESVTADEAMGVKAAGPLRTFMEAFMLMTGSDRDWNETIVPTFATAGWKKLGGMGTPLDLLNPEVIMTDGWLCSEPVDYRKAVTSVLVSPLEFATGSPCKVALTSEPMPDAQAKEAVTRAIAIESSVKEVRALSDSRLSSGAKLEALFAPRAFETKPIALMVRRAVSPIFFDAELSLKFKGRAPLHLYTGELDATHIMHSSFEAFAHDLGMAPEALASFLKVPVLGEEKSGSAKHRYPGDLRFIAYVRLFFRTASGSMDFSNRNVGSLPAGKKSIFEINAAAYGLSDELQFSNTSYYVSARTTMFPHSTMVSLIPQDTSGVSIVTREMGINTQRYVFPFVTMISDPLQKEAHSGALRNATSVETLITSDWAVKFPTRV